MIFFFIMSVKSPLEGPRRLFKRASYLYIQYTELLSPVRRVAQTLLVTLYLSKYMNDAASCTTSAELRFDDALS